MSTQAQPLQSAPPPSNAVSLDFSKAQPIAPDNTSATPPSNAVSLDFGNAVPLQPQSDAESFADNLKSAVAGPNTALGSQGSPQEQNETSGMSDILHGNFSQGVSKIWNAEQPHVIPGSPLEKAIQFVDPDFKGQGTAPAPKAISQPLVDAAQFIDKDQHPIAKAVVEAGQNFTSPESVAVMASTGGLGLVESPAALSVANRLMSAGFSAQAIGSAYKSLKSFKAAYDAGNESDAEYQLTHALLSGAVSVAAGSHAAGTPVVPAIADKVGDVVENAKDSVADYQQSKADEADQEEQDQALQDLKAAIPPSRSNRLTDDDYASAKDLITPEMVDSTGIEAIRDASAKAISNIEDQVSNAISSKPDVTIESPIEAVKAELMKNLRGQSFADAGLDAIADFKPEETKTLQEADDIRRQLNAENQNANNGLPVNQNVARVANPAYAAREAYARALRDAIYDHLPEMKNLRQQEGSVIKINRAAEQQMINGDKSVRASNSPLRNFAGSALNKAATVGGVALGNASGIPGAGAAGALLGGEFGAALEKAVRKTPLTKNQLADRALGKK